MTNPASEMNPQIENVQAVMEGNGYKPMEIPSANDTQVVIQNMTINYLNEIVNKNETNSSHTNINSANTTQNGPGSNFHGMQGFFPLPYRIPGK